MTYIPGFSSQKFIAGLDRDTRSTQQELRGYGRGLQVAGDKGKFMGTLLGAAAKYGGTALAGMIGGPLAGLVVPAMTRSAGEYLGRKMMGRGSKIPSQSKTGLLGSQFDALRAYRKDMPENWKGAAMGAFGSEIMSGLKSDVGKELMTQMGDAFPRPSVQSSRLEGYDPSKAIPSDLSSDILPNMPGDPMSELAGMAEEEFGPEAGIMDKLRGRFGQFQDWNESFQNQKPSWGKPDWWQDPQAAAWDKQGNVSKMMGSQWGGYQEGGEVESDDEQFSEHYIDWLYMLEKEDPKGFIKQITDWKKRGQSPEDYFDMYNSAIESGEFRPDSLYMKYNPDFISPSPMWHPDTLEKKRQEREMMPKMDPSRYQQGGHVPQYQMGGLIQYRKGY